MKNYISTIKSYFPHIITYVCGFGICLLFAKFLTGLDTDKNGIITALCIGIALNTIARIVASFK